MTVRKSWLQYQQWQRDTSRHITPPSDEQHHCHCCESDYRGNFCPCCGQKANEGPISWLSVRSSVMDLWGFGSRSMSHTLLQLLFRPGYLISDYISGKRQVSFPPVKMLFLVSVIVVFWIYYLLPMLIGNPFDIYGGRADFIDGFAAWTKGHFVWTYFILATVFILPTWVMFRYAPRHTRHSFPQGFFIQIFLLVLNLIVSFIILSPIIPYDFDVYYTVSVVVLFVYYIITMRQLFGYGIWGTLWRMMFVLGVSIFLTTALVFIPFDINAEAWDVTPSHNDNFKYYFVGVAVFYSLLILCIGWGVNMIATRKFRQTERKQEQKGREHIITES